MPEPAPRAKDRPLPRRSLDDIVESFEIAWNRDKHADVADFLPDEAHPDFNDVMLELLAVDLERRWQRGDAPSLEPYLQRFPQLARHADVVERLAFEQYRLLRSHGHAARPEDFAARYHIDAAHWPRPDSTHVDTATAVVVPHRGGSDQDDLALNWNGPQVGERFLEFDIIQRLGVGKFGRVYRARQAHLAGRQVVLKITAQRWCESDQLARLQHTHIVPIHSVHQYGNLQVVCMPYFGRHTLADALRGLGPREQLSAADFLKRIEPDDALENARDGAAANVDRRRSELSRLTFEQLAITLIAAITSGIAHAHARGILHRDLKPANILLTDDVQPMILDFNLSQNVDSAESTSQLVGGTLPYMAPEHLRATVGRGRADARSDVYAIGVLLFEILTGQLPFPTDSSAFPEAVDAMVDQRRRKQPSAQSINPRVSPAVDSIIRRCLDPDASRRYQSAAELLEDLQRQRSDLPLKFAPDRSWRERSRKWMRRHPRLASAGGLSVVAAGIILLMAATLVWRGHRLNQLNALDQFQKFQSLADRAVMQLSLLGENAPPRAGAMTLGDEALAIYSVGQPDWLSKRVYRSLPDTDRQQLRASLKELLYSMASTEQRAARATEPGAKLRLSQALNYNSLAQQLGDGGWLRSLKYQQAELEQALGRSEAAERLRLAAQQDDALQDPDDFLAALQKVWARQFVQAEPLLQRYTRNHPENPLAWFLLGNCYFAMQADQDAEVCYTHCIANLREADAAYVRRGLVRIQLKRWQQAEADFTEALRRYPDPADLLMNRALARRQQGRLKEAMDDYTAAIEHGRQDSLVFLLRSDAAYRLGDDQQGDRDLREGLRREPIDDDGYIQRSAKRFAMGDADGALADVDQALRLNPTSSRALNNRALILANAFERFAEAIESLDRVLELEPQNTNAWVMRGMLKARTEDREGAIADARQAVRIKPAALTFYQATMILATASVVETDDAVAPERVAAEAVRLLSVAVDLDPRLARDAQVEPELAPVRGRADFLEVLKAVAVSQQADASLISPPAVD